MKENLTRRQMLKLGGAALAAIPVLTLTREASAATNAAMRSSMKYQDKPNGEKKCSGCMQFIPGKTADALGGCKQFAAATEISPNGYCLAWTAKK